MRNTKPVAFVDYENFGNFYLQIVPDEYQKIYIFIGSHQKSMSLESFIGLLPFGKFVEMVRISEQRRNSLDFRLVFYMGRCDLKYPKEVEFVVFSNDHDFDTTINYLNHSDRPSKRVQRAKPLLAAAQTKVMV